MYTYYRIIINDMGIIPVYFYIITHMQNIINNFIQGINSSIDIIYIKMYSENIKIYISGGIFFMKKVVTLVLALSLIVFGSAMAASAAEIALKTDGLGRGAGDPTVVENADGSLTSASSNISFILPETVKAGETITVHIAGSSADNFRVWLIDTNETTNSNLYVMADNGFTSGEFHETFDLTATADSTELFFKGASWNTPINNLTLTEVSITGGAFGDDADFHDDAEEEAVAEEEVAEEEAAAVEEAEVAEVTVAPKTGETSYAVVYIALMGLAAVGFAVSKKKVVKE